MGKGDTFQPGEEVYLRLPSPVEFMYAKVLRQDDRSITKAGYWVEVFVFADEMRREI